jgi:archaellum biogenesis protein FlaJ (TadC family)
MERDTTLPAEARTKQRDQTAGELVRALLIINGGGAVALLAFLQAIWSSDKAVAKSVVIALVVFAIGAALAAAFHLFRHQASWYQQSDEHAQWEKFRRFYLLSASLSLVAFVVGVAVVATGVWNALHR